MNEPPRATRFTKSVKVRAPRSVVGGPGPVPGGTRPCVHTRGSDVHQRIPGHKTGFSIWHRRRSSGPRGPADATASNLDTLLDRGFDRRVRMLLSFQRPSHLFGRGFLPRAHPRSFRSQSGPVSIAPEPPHGEGAYPGWPGQSTARGFAISAAPLPPSDGCSCFGQRSGMHEPSIAWYDGWSSKPGGRPPRHLLTTGPGRSPSAGGDGRRSRSARPAARSRVRGARR
jgi:hypothetical protein